MPVISIIQASYCGGEVITQQVAEKLELERINDYVLERAADRLKTDSGKLLRALAGPAPLLNKLTHERECNLAGLKIAMAEVLERDDVYMDGCLGFLLPWTVSHILRICIVANFDYRLRQATQLAKLSEGEARKRLHKDDEGLQACTSFLFDKSAYDEALYDTVIPMQDRSIEDAAELILKLAGADQVRVTERSRQAARDFRLAAEVQLALAKEGLQAEAHADRGTVTLLINQYTVRLEKFKERLIETARSVDGVIDAVARKGPRYKAPSINPWSDIEGPPKVLLVDDEKDFVHTLSERLKTRDLESAIAYDGEQALSMLSEDVPDVMVLDLMMPGINGIEVLRRVKREHPQVEVIILTGHGSEAEREQAEELGAFAYLQKPANVDVLARVMREAYEKVNQQKGTLGSTTDAGEE